MTVKISTGTRNKIAGINPTKITNGTFEAATTGWAGTSATVALTGGGDGANGTTDSLTVTGSGAAGYAGLSTPLTLKCGHLIYFSCYFKKGSGTNGQIEIGTSAGAADIYDSGSITDAAWTKYETWFTVPGTVGDTDEIYISLNTDADAVTQLYDEVVVTSMSRSVQDLFRGGQLEFYSGLQPSSPDDAPTGTHLLSMKNGTAGVTFDDASSGTISKASGETWTGVGIADGTAGYCRLVTSNDTGGSSTTDERIDLSVATTGADVNFGSTAWTTGATQTLTVFTVTMPAS